MLVDTHCHIHEADYPLDSEEVLKRAHENGVTKIICVGTNIEDSLEAINFASNHSGVYATVGIHPYYAKNGVDDLEFLINSHHQSIVAIGEIGLDYHNDQSLPEDQKKLLKLQIELALKYGLPIIFHVREAFDDFWPIFDSYKGIRGVLHSFTDTADNAQKALDRGLYIGVNGYSTFTRDESQKAMFASLPLDKLLLETDAPFLTPAPFRGKINESAFVRIIAEYQSTIRQISFDEIAAATTTNATELFKL